MSILIVAPLAIELGALREHLQKRGWKECSLQKGPLTLFHYPEKQMYLSLSGHGKSQSAVQTQFLLTQFPDIQKAVLVGAAGALSKDLAIGDVIVAQKTIEHDYQLKFISRPLPEFAANNDLLQILKKAVPHSYTVHFATVASGDEDIVDTTRARELQQNTQAVAVAWEGAGFARACRFQNTPFVEVRGITDNADHTAIDNFKNNLTVAMHNIIDLLSRSLLS